MKAVFLDRDGVINELVFDAEHGRLDSPYTTEQFKLVDGICESINRLHELGFKVIVVSNQPGIAKGYITEGIFKRISRKMKDDLLKGGDLIDAEYYCFHHPDSMVAELKVICTCRKPRPGLILKAAEEMSIDLSNSWMIGDNITDIQAGINAGCKTILIGKRKCETCRLLDENSLHPDHIISGVHEIGRIIAEDKNR